MRITASNITVRYSPLVALDRVSLSVGAGETIAVVGKSGSGKTTLLSVLAGLTQPTAGEIDWSPLQALPAVILQESGVFPWLTVADNIAYPLRLRGEPKATVRSTVERWLSRISLRQYRDFWPRQLSGGMNKRVELARALGCRSAALVMDEPFGALDAQTRQDMQDLLQSCLMDQPSTCIVATHDIEEAVFVANRVLVLQRPPDSLFAEYEIDLPMPRAAHVRYEPEFLRLREAIADSLRHSH